jgi:anti-sigma regulatory factor (Ser/Thr protein kinase)
MDVTLSLNMGVTERSEASEAWREAERLAVRLGFSKLEVGAVAIIVTEVAKNLVKYASKGELIIQTLESEGRFGIELIALDRGPGMRNPAACLQDGFSTGGSPGTGLGAMNRLSTVFDIFSTPGAGTALVSRFWPKANTVRSQGIGWEIAALCIPKSGQTTCGDGWACEEVKHGKLLLVTDGLGHGPLAAEASREAVKAFHAHSYLRPSEILKAIHEALRSTRGAAVALAHVDTKDKIVRFVGVGNISGTIMGSTGSRNMVSHNGTVGSEMRKIQEFEYPWFEDAVLVMHSDGISSRWSLDAYPGLIKRHPSLMGAVLYRDFGRGTDDSTIVVVRQAKGRRVVGGSDLAKRPREVSSNDK